MLRTLSATHGTPLHTAAGLLPAFQAISDSREGWWPVGGLVQIRCALWRPRLEERKCAT